VRILRHMAKIAAMVLLARGLHFYKAWSCAAFAANA